VGDQDEGLPGGVQLEQQLADLLAGRGVERAGRLVGEEQLRPVHQGPCDRDPLPLPAGEPRRVRVPVLPDPQRREQLIDPRPRLRLRLPAELRGQQHVVRDRHVVEQVEELEDHPDPPAPEPRRAGLAEHVDPLITDPHRAARRPVKPGDQVEQRGLSAARRPHHRDGLTVRDRHADIGHRGRPAVFIPFGYVVELHEDTHAGTVRRPLSPPRPPPGGSRIP